MKISEILAKREPSISFEVFPPKKDRPLEGTKEIVSEIAAEGPSFMSVTYGAAGGSTGANTLAIAEHLQKSCGVPVLAHLTCIGATSGSIAGEVESFRSGGIENVLCLRGDFPPGAALPESADFLHASDLVKALSGKGFCLGGACYPEGHPESAHFADDIVRVREKVDLGLDFLTTQMFFDNSLYYSFLYRVREAGVTVPIFPGIMPITSATQIKRAIELSGSFMPHRFLALVDRFGSDPEAMKQAGIAYATDQIIDLYANGVQNVHVYTMNKPDVAAKIMDNVSAILK